MEEAEAGYFSTPSKRRPAEFFQKLSFWSVPWGMQDSASDCCLDSLKL